MCSLQLELGLLSEHAHEFTGYLSYLLASWTYLFRMHALKGILTQGLLIWKLMSSNYKGPPRSIRCWISHWLYKFGHPNCFSLQTVHVDQMSGASTVLFTFTLDRGITWEVCFPLQFLVWQYVDFHKKPNKCVIHLPVSPQVPFLTRSERMGLVQQMMDSMNLKGSGWGGVTSH